METTTLQQETGVYRKTIHSGKWFSFGIVAQRAVSFVALIILARLLTPADYGILAIVFLITGILDDILTPSFGTALLQKKEKVDEYLAVVWTWDVLGATALAFLIFLFSGPISAFFKVPDSQLIIGLSGLLLIIASLSNKRQLYFFKELEFKKVFLRDFVGQIAYAAIAIGWALFIEPTVWALFIGQVGRYVVSALMTYILEHDTITFDFHFTKMRDLIGYTKWIYGQNLLNYFLTSLDKILIGKMLNATELGLYSRAKDLPSLVSSPLSSAVNRVGFSAFVKVQDQLDKLQDGFLKSMDLLLLTTLPLSILILLEGGTLVSAVLGPKWLAMVIPFKLFSIGNIFITLVGLTRPLFNAIGKPEVNFKANILQLIVAIPLLYFGITQYQLRGAVIATISIWFIVFLYTIYAARPILKLGKNKFIPTVITIGCASIGTLVLDILVRDFVHTLNYFYQLGWVAVLGLAYMAMIWWVNTFFKIGPWHTLMSVYRELKRKKPVEVPAATQLE